MWVGNMSHEFISDFPPDRRVYRVVTCLVDPPSQERNVKYKLTSISIVPLVSGEETKLTEASGVEHLVSKVV
jgi:hypothetical protein